MRTRWPSDWSIRVCCGLACRARYTHGERSDDAYTKTGAQLVQPHYPRCWSDLCPRELLIRDNHGDPAGLSGGAGDPRGGAGDHRRRGRCGGEFHQFGRRPCCRQVRTSKDARASGIWADTRRSGVDRARSRLAADPAGAHCVLVRQRAARPLARRDHRSGNHPRDPRPGTAPSAFTGRWTLEAPSSARFWGSGR